MRRPLLWLMLPLIRQAPRSRAATGGASRVADFRRLPLRQSHGGTNSPLHTPRRFRRRLLVDVRPRVSTVGQRPTFSDQPGVDVLPALPAHGNDAPIPITIALFASDRAVVDSSGKRLRRLAPARPGAARCNPALRALWCIHAKETDPRRADLDRVAVDHPRAPRQIRLNRLASSALGAIATSIRSDSRIACPHCHRRGAVREDFEGLHPPQSVPNAEPAAALRRMP